MAPAYVYAPVISRGGGGMGRSGANFGPGPGVPQLRDPNGDPMEFPDEVNRRFQFDASTENPSTGEDSQTREPRAGLRGGGGVGMGVSGMVFVGLVLGCIEAKFCK